MRLASALILALLVALGCASPSPTPRSPAAPLGSADAPSNGVPEESREPQPTLTPVPTEAGLITIDYPTRSGKVIPLSVVDAEALGLGVRLATPAEEKIGERSLDDVTDTGMVQVSPREMLLTWVGGPCERGYTLSLADQTRISITGAPRPACDTARVIYFAVLSLPGDIETTSPTLSLEPPVIFGG